MALSFIGVSTSSATTCAIPAHVAGDLIIIVATQSSTGGAVIPTCPAPFTTIFSGQGLGSSPSSANIIVGWMIATGSGTTSGTWTTANKMTAAVYRGAHPTAPIGNVGSPVGQLANTLGTFATPTLTTMAASGSWVLYAFSAAQATDAPPVSLTNRSNVTGNGLFDSNAAVSTWAGDTHTLTGAGGKYGYAGDVFEIRADSINNMAMVV